MSQVDAKLVGKLRQETGAPMMDCKKALQEADGNWDRAKELLRLRGMQAATTRAARDTAEGRVFSYVHTGEKIGVLLEIDCETDFVARNADFVEFGHNLCLHIAFTRPRFLSREDVDPAAIEKERAFLAEKVAEQMAGKPAEIQQKAIDGGLRKFYEEQCLLEQAYVRDDSKTIESWRKEMVAKIGENLVIKRFAVFAVGQD